MPIFAEEIQNIRTMIRIYGMHTCPDCACIEEQVKDNDGYEIIDIGEHVRNLKAFLRLRDSSPVFDEARRNGSIGQPQKGHRAAWTGAAAETIAKATTDQHRPYRNRTEQDSGSSHLRDPKQR